MVSRPRKAAGAKRAFPPVTDVQMKKYDRKDAAAVSSLYPAEDHVSLPETGGGRKEFCLYTRKIVVGYTQIDLTCDQYAGHDVAGVRHAGSLHSCALPQNPDTVIFFPRGVDKGDFGR